MYISESVCNSLQFTQICQVIVSILRRGEVDQYLIIHEAIYKLKPSTTNWIPGIVVGATATKHGLQLLCAKLLASLLHH